MAFDAAGVCGHPEAHDVEGLAADELAALRTRFNRWLTTSRQLRDFDVDEHLSLDRAKRASGSCKRNRRQFKVL